MKRFYLDQRLNIRGAESKGKAFLNCCITPCAAGCNVFQIILSNGFTFFETEGLSQISETFQSSSYTLTNSSVVQNISKLFHKVYFGKLKNSINLMATNIREGQMLY